MILTSDTGFRAHVLTWGAVIRTLSMRHLEGRQSIVLGFDDFASYPARSPYFGAVVGRYANRIAQGRFTLDGKVHRLHRNENGAHTLHGGAGGTSGRIWTILDHSGTHVSLGLRSPDGDQGFPGAVAMTCRYDIGPGDRIGMTTRAVTDRATPFGLSQHSYFNLDGGPDLSDHQLEVCADVWTPVDDAKIPTGDIADVAGTFLDFRAARRFGPDAVDHNLVLRPQPGLRPAAVLSSMRSGLRLAIQTTKPALQVYDGHLVPLGLVGLGGRRYGPGAGVCLEPQYCPDGPNKPAFGDVILRPDRPYDHRTVWSVSTI